MLEHAARSVNTRPRWVRLVFACATIAGSACALAEVSSAAETPQLCEQGPARGIPARAPGAATGSEFARRVQDLSGLSRDALARSELLTGDVPDFLRRLVPVTVAGFDGERPVKITVCVLPDYLALGSDTDFVRVPLGLKAALDVARDFGFILPTPKLVDAIYESSRVRLEPRPLPASDEMRSTAYFVYHNELVDRERAEQAAPLGELTAGDKKDLVLTSLLWRAPGRVAIYGWHRAVDQPIQPLSTVHGARYADYSHGVRLVSTTAYVDGAKRSLEELLADRKLSHLLTREGSLPQLGEHLTALMAQLAEDERTASVAGLSRAGASAEFR